MAGRTFFTGFSFASCFLDLNCFRCWQLEFEVKQVYGELLESKSKRWEQCRTHAADCADELAEFFSGSKVSFLINTENLLKWFLFIVN